jgi:hypothetical protein
MKLDNTLKVSLDELRMQMLGAQMSLGFGFQGVFQDGWEALPLLGRRGDAIGLGLMVVATPLYLMRRRQGDQGVRYATP